MTKLNRKEELAKIENKLYPPKPENDSLKVEGKALAGKNSNINVGVINGKALKLVAPPYPAEARASRISGTVNVSVTIDETGKVIRACAVSGAKELQRASEIAAYQSKFSPTVLSGQPVKVIGIIVYKYVAQ